MDKAAVAKDRMSHRVVANMMGSIRNERQRKTSRVLWRSEDAAAPRVWHVNPTSSSRGRLTVSLDIYLMLLVVLVWQPAARGESGTLVSPYDWIVSVLIPASIATLAIY